MNINGYITTLNVNKLKGRILQIPAPVAGAREVLFVYGHHSSIERWQGIAKLLGQHFAVTMPDLPGFGGMQDLYKIGKDASLDNIADWLADFIKTHYKNRTFVLVGMSLGFVVATRMLQRHPDVTKNVRMLISYFGFAHHDDFIMPAKRRKVYLRAASMFSLPLLSGFYRRIFLSRFVLSRAYHRTPNAKEKFKNATPAQHKENMEFEIKLWQQSDARTYMQTTKEFLTLDNTRIKVDLPVYHVSVAHDRFFNNDQVEKHFRTIFTSYTLLTEIQNGNHAPTSIKTIKEAESFIPAALITAIRG